MTMARRQSKRSGRKRRGFGGIRQLPSGNHQAYYRGPDLARHVAPRTFSLKADAEAWLTTERAYWDGLVKTGQLDKWKTPASRHAADRDVLTGFSSAPTLEEYAARYMARPELRPSYVARAQSLLKLHILPALGTVRLPDLTKATVRGWWASLDPAKRRTNDLAYQLLRGIMNAAVDDEYVTESPVAVKGAGKASRTKGPATMTPAQVQAIVDNMPDRLALAISLMAWTGLRSGEVYELRRRDIEPDCSVIHVTRSVTRGPDGLTVGPPKTDAGVRDETIPEPLRPLLKDHLRNHAQIGADGLLFYSRAKGCQVLETERRVAFKRACDAAGVSGFTPHDLRAFALTQAGIAGATLRELQAMAGHATAQMVMRYQRQDPEHRADVVRRIGERIAAG